MTPHNIFHAKTINPTMTAHLDILRNFNAWRRGADIPQPDPKVIREAIDHLIAAYPAIERERDVWRHEAELLRAELAKADEAIQANLETFFGLRSQIAEVLDELAIAKRDMMS